MAKRTSPFHVVVGLALVLAQCRALAPLMEPLATAAPLAGAAALAAIAGGADMIQLLPTDQAAALLQGPPPDEAVTDAGVIAAGGAAYASGLTRTSMAPGLSALTARTRKAESARDVLSDLGVIDQDAPALDSESSELDMATLAKALDRCAPRDPQSAARAVPHVFRLPRALSVSRGSLYSPRCLASAIAGATRSDSSSRRRRRARARGSRASTAAGRLTAGSWSGLSPISRRTTLVLCAASARGRARSSRPPASRRRATPTPRAA